LPAEVQERIVLETAVAMWRDSRNADVSHVLRPLGEVSPLWANVIVGNTFKRRLTERLERLLRDGIQS